MKKKKIDTSKIKTASDLFKAKYGKIGTKSREKFQEEAQRFYISEMLKNKK